MKGYESYKTSKIEGIKEVPYHWKPIKLKFIGNLYSGLTGKSGNDFYNEDNPLSRPYINFKNIANNVRINPKQFDLVEIKPNEEQNQVKKGDLFFLMSSENFDDIAKTAVLVDDLNETYLNSFCRGFRIHDENFVPEFLNYLLLSGHYREILSNEAKGFTRINIQVGKINNFPIYAPFNKEEQTTIASFLDYKTNLIDATIEKKKRLIDLLKEKRQAVINEAVTKGVTSSAVEKPNATMKDSGVEWLEEIPEHWAVKKLKHIADISFSSVDRHEYNDELKVSICHYPDAYKNDKINSETVLSSGTCTSLEYEKYQLKKGQVIITKDSESANDIGVPTYVEETIENAVCGYHLAILEPQSTKIQGEFLFRFIQTSNVAIYFENNSNGVTRFGLGKPKIENLYVVLPSIEEQSTIIEYINYQSELIDKSVSKIKLVIEKLETYRQSLISEAVTGKIDVRDWEITKN